MNALIAVVTAAAYLEMVRRTLAATQQASKNIEEKRKPLAYAQTATYLWTKFSARVVRGISLDLPVNPVRTVSTSNVIVVEDRMLLLTEFGVG